MSGLAIGSLLPAFLAPKAPTPDSERNQVWRRSYAVGSPRADVSAVYWPHDAKRSGFFKFWDAYRETVHAYSAERRKAGQSNPISRNALAVLDGVFAFMDARTGRCDPSLIELAHRCKLSLRTIVRALAVLRDHNILNWVRRVEPAGDSLGAGARWKQTSSAFFICLVSAPEEIRRTLRQRLGDRLIETGRRVEGSGRVPSRMAIAAGRLLNGAARALGGDLGREQAERNRLAAGSHVDRLAHIYGDDYGAMQQHLELEGYSIPLDVLIASVTQAMKPPPRKGYKRNEGARAPSCAD